MNTNSLLNSPFVTRSLNRWLSSLLVVTTLLIADAGRVFAVTITNGHAIEGYSDVQSVSPGETIGFHVHLPGSHTHYTVEIFRFGLAYSGGNALGTRVAGPYLGSNGAPQNYEDNSHEIGANWSPSFSLRVPSAALAGVAPFTLAPIPRTTWKSGIYTAKITDTDSPSLDYFHITFIVKDSLTTRKSIALIASTNTWQAYNYWPEPGWGGSSIYGGANGVGAAKNTVSFLRPNAYATPQAYDDVSGLYLHRPFYRTEHLAAGELRIAHWLEVNAKAYSMLTDWDLDSITDVLDPAVFKTVIISTHSEYWTTGMHNAVKQYLSKGGNVISLSGNTCFWHTTLAGAGGGNRTLTKGAKWDQQDQVKLLGLASFGDSGVGELDCTPYTLTRRKHWSLGAVPALTSLGSNGIVFNRSFARFGRGASGWEVDRTDPSLHVFAREYTDLAESTNAFRDGLGASNFSHMLYMRRASAGQVFSVGSILAGQSLMVDTNFSKQMLTVLNKFATPSFSDYTGNGHPDLVGLKPDGTLWSYDTDGAGNLSAGVRIATAWNGYNLLLSPGDMDGNGRSDLIARGVDGKLWLYKRNAITGALLPRVQIGTGWNAYDAVLTPGDFDHDGRPDLIARKPDGTLWLFKGTGAGTLTTPANSFNSAWNVYTNMWSPGDLDEDGHPDILVRTIDNKLKFYRGDGNGNIVAGVPLEVGSGWIASTDIITSGDFNGDGHGDIIARKADGTLSLYKADWIGGTFIGLLTPTNDLDNGWQVFNNVVAVW